MDTDAFEVSVQDEWFDCIGNIAFFGGEPTLHPRLGDLYQKIVARWPRAIRSIVTWGGGKHALATLQKMVEIEPKFMLCVSLDGSKDIHNERRGRDYAYDDALAVLRYGVKHLEPLAPRVRMVRISFTATGKTVGELRHIIQLARSFDADISMRPAMTGSYFNTEQTRPGTEWTEEQIQEFEEIISTLPDADLAMAHFARAMPHFLRDGEHLPCRAPVDAIVCDPDLRVRYCHELPPVCALRDYPDHYAQSGKWLKAVEAAREGDCFKKSCFIDGPYSIAYAMTREGAFSGKRSHHA